MKTFLLKTLLLLALPGWELTVYGQSSPFEPKTPEPLGGEDRPAALPPPPATADAAAASAGDDAILNPMLKGVVFLSDKRALRPEGVTMTGVESATLPLLAGADFARITARYLGQPVTIRRLNQMTHEVVVFYREHGHPIVDVLVPEQDISRGTVQVLVVEGRLGRVRVEGNTHFSSGLIAAQVRTQPGAPIEGPALLADLTWLNQNPFRQVDLVFARGDQPGLTDVLLRTKDRLPLRVYTGYEDSGNAATDENRVLLGVNWGKAFGRDQQLNYQFMASPDFKRLLAHSGSYVIPLPWRHTLTFFGSYATSLPDLAGGIFSLKGKSWQASARYSMPLPEIPRLELTQKLAAGFDLKRSNNNLAFGGFEVFNRQTDVAQFVASYSASTRDRFGATSAEVEVVASPGGLTSYNHTANFDAARSLARANYTYGNLALQRTTTLPAGFIWTARLTVQLADRNLLSSEQLGLGGYDTLPGYEEREANGDNGFILANELQAPVFSPLKLLGRKSAADQMKLLVFWDHGEVGSHRLLPDEDAHLVLESVGPGLRYALAPYLTLRFDYGWQLRRSGVSDGSQNQRGHIGVVIAY
jgi:hemolysin activation/secretion protein